MSEDRRLMIYVEKRSLFIDDARDLKIQVDRRVLDIQDEGRVLEVRLP